MHLLRTLSFATLAVLFSLIFIGGYVSASGVGLTCPNWPLCPHGFLPHWDFIIEYFHRSVAATTSTLVITTMAFTLKSKGAPKGMKIASIIAAGAVIGQVTLGGIVIVERLHAILVTALLGLGIVLFSMMLIVTRYAFRISSSKEINASSTTSRRSNLSAREH
jgi:cytochrome c oxidase assembly protein subunit 15